MIDCARKRKVGDYSRLASSLSDASAIADISFSGLDQDDEAKYLGVERNLEALKRKISIGTGQVLMLSLQLGDFIELRKVFCQQAVKMSAKSKASSHTLFIPRF